MINVAHSGVKGWIVMLLANALHLISRDEDPMPVGVWVFFNCLSIAAILTGKWIMRKTASHQRVQQLRSPTYELSNPFAMRVPPSIGRQKRKSEYGQHFGHRGIRRRCVHLTSRR